MELLFKSFFTIHGRHVRSECCLEVPLVNLPKGHGVGPRRARDVHELGRELLHHRGHVGRGQGGHDVFFFFFDGWQTAVRRLARRRKHIRELPTSSRLSIVLSLDGARAQATGIFTINAIGPHVMTNGALEHLGSTKKRPPTSNAMTNVVIYGFLQMVIHEAPLTDFRVRCVHCDPTSGALPARAAEELRVYISASFLEIR